MSYYNSMGNVLVNPVVPKKGDIVARGYTRVLEKYKECFQDHNIQFVGKGGSDRILLAVWNRTSEFSKKSIPYIMLHRATRLHSVKDNIMKPANNHHGSKGFSAGFGLCRSLTGLIFSFRLITIAASYVTKKVAVPGEEEYFLKEQLLAHIDDAIGSVESFLLKQREEA
jgi:hypothetical protein